MGPIAMNMPQFNAEERYVLAYYKRGVTADSWGLCIAHVLLVLLFAYGFYIGDHALLFAAFGTAVGWRFYEQFQRPRYLRAIQGVIEKYEASLASPTQAAESDVSSRAAR